MAARGPLRLHLRLRLRRWPRRAAAIAPRVWRRARSVEEGAPRRRQGRRLAPGPRPAPPRPTTDCPVASARTFNAVRVGCWLLSCLVTRWPSPVRLAARGPLACSPPPPRFPAPPRLPPHARAYRGRARWRRAPAQTEQRPRAQRSLLRPSVACARCCLRCYPRRPPLSFPGTSPESNVAMRARCAPRRVHGADSHPCPHTEQRPLLRPSVARVRCRLRRPRCYRCRPHPFPGASRVDF